MILFVVVSVVVLLTVAVCNVLLWKYPLERRSRAVKLAACVALCLSITVLTVGILTESALGPEEERRTHSEATPCVDVDYEDFDGEYGGYESKGTNTSLHNRCPFSIFPRSDWVTTPSMAKGHVDHPVELVAVSSTNTATCSLHAECTLAIHILQVFHTEGIKWLDVGYNFFVGGDGQAYEGRGWDIAGDQDAGLNATILGISFVGSFTSQGPPRNQVKACRSLIREGVRLKKISPDYKLIALRRNTGRKLLNELRKWPRWSEEIE